MAGIFKIKGGTPDKRLDFLEKILPRIFKRLNKHVVSVTPPSVIHCFKKTPDEDGTIWKFGAVNSKIIKISILADLLPDTDIIFECEISNNEGRQAVNIEIKDQMTVKDLDFSVIDGTVLTIRSKSGAVGVSNIAITLICIIQAGDHYVEKHLLDVIDRNNANEISKLSIQ